jgi:hypothetical protein
MTTLNSAEGLARNGKFVEPDQSVSTRPALFAKIFRFAATPNHPYIVSRPGPQRGVS